MKNLIIISIIATSAFATSYSYAKNTEQITAAGSSTVYPFVTTAAEEFARRTGNKTPIIESTGTGGGFKIFCKGIGIKTIDLTNASRVIKKSERKLCAQNGVTFTELKIGFDGIVLANSNDAPLFKLTTHQIFLALAKKTPANGKLIKNPYKKWSDIDKSLPKKKISVYGPPPTSGTRDAFVELIMQKACVNNIPEFKTAFPNKKERKQACSLLREDGKYIEAGENDNIIIQKLTRNTKALGIFGYSFLIENEDDIKASIINNKEANFKNISSGAYPVARSLFVYVKNAHFRKKISLKSFAKELVSKDASGANGYLTYKGLIPLTKRELTLEQKKLN